MPAKDVKALMLLDILQLETDAAHRLSAPALVKKLSARGVKAERRSVYRAIEGLRAHGERIEKTTTGYYYAHDAPDEDAVFALAAAVQGAWFLPEARRAGLLGLLAARCPNQSAQTALRARADTVFSAPAEDDALFLSMRTASRAIAARSQLTFSAPDEPARQRVNPYALFLSDGACWLICNVDGQDGLARFPLGAVRGLRVEAQPRRSFTEVSPYKKRFDAADAMRRLSARDGG